MFQMVWCLVVWFPAHWKPLLGKADKEFLRKQWLRTQQEMVLVGASSAPVDGWYQLIGLSVRWENLVAVQARCSTDTEPGTLEYLIKAGPEAAQATALVGLCSPCLYPRLRKGARDREAGIRGQRCVPLPDLKEPLEHFSRAFSRASDRHPVPHPGELSLASLRGAEENWAQETSPKQLCFHVK